MRQPLQPAAPAAAFPWLKDAFNTSYAELGVLLTVFFVVLRGASGLGFVVGRFGPRPILFDGIALLAAAAFGSAASTSYAMLVAFAVVAGIGNGVFHPVNYILLNRKVHGSRSGHAGPLMDLRRPADVWLGIAIAQALLIATAFNVHRARRTTLRPATA